MEIMHSFWKSARLKVMIGVLAALIIGAVFAAVSQNGTSPFASAVEVVFSPMQRLSSAVSNLLDDATVSFRSSKLYAEEVNQLKKQVEEYQAQVVDNEQLKQKLKAYEDVLGVKEEHSDFEFQPAFVIGRDSADKFYSFVLNKGSSDGVSVNDPVISGKYLVGRVAKVTSHTSVVLTVLDPKVNVSAYEVRTREQGFATSSIELSKDGLARLSGLERSTAIAPEGIVCTSGVGGIYPRDLIVGTVREVLNDEHDISSYAVLEPGVDIAHLQDVFVITDFEGQSSAQNEE